MDAPQAPSPAYFDLVCSRLRDFFADRAPWHRRLWSIGIVLGLQEALEYADDCMAGRASNTEGLKFVVGTARRVVDRDPGVAHMASEIDGLLGRLEVKSPKDVSRGLCDELGHLAHRARDDYLNQWVNAPADLPVEFAARAIASHLLDMGFSSTHLHRWLQGNRSSLTALPELAEEAAGMVAEMRPREFGVFVPCSAPYAKPSEPSGSVTWMDGRAAAEWLRANVPEAESRRHGGGLLVAVEQRDPWAAVDAARSVVARSDARARVARLNDESIRMDGWARVAGNQRSFDVSHQISHVEIGSLDRQASVYRFDGSLPTATDDALELASYMQSPSAGAAIIGGWSAIEGLLIRPGEGQYYLAADRLAALVTCSLPRAELTPLAHRHMRAADDTLTRSLEAAESNYARVKLVASHLSSGGQLALTHGSDVAAQNRIVAILRNPSDELQRIRLYVTESLRRLYNQRSAHSGVPRSHGCNVGGDGAVVTRRRGLLYHFTHMSNLVSIAEEGLYSDVHVVASSMAPTQIGNADVKQRRRNVAVPLQPYGRVADYVPFYFAARSPMLYIISQGDVPTYSGGQDEIVYLVTSIDRVVEEGLGFVFTDRNAALGFARYGDDLHDLDDYLDWELMEGRMWNNTAEEPDRQERRMAEFLVHGHVPWSAFVGVAARTDEACRQAEHALASVGREIPVRPRPEWYF